jgi:hypothetical protein
MLLPQPRNAKTHTVPRLQKPGRLHIPSDPGRRARRYNVTRLQGHELADVVHQMSDPKNHSPRVALLHAFAVQIEPEVQSLRIVDLVASN